MRFVRAAHKFQSTLPRRSDVKENESYYRKRCFNPRSRVGERPSPRRSGRGDTVSIHAPAGSDSASPGMGRSRNVTFQSTLPRGERPFPALGSLAPLSFNPRSPRGSDREMGNRFWAGKVSIHAPAGSDYRLFFNRFTVTSFNPRSRAGSDLQIAIAK